jgi:glutaredoxin-like protein DUF836
VSNVEVELLSREGCHLCDDALVELEKLSLEHPLTVRIVDIDTDPSLRERRITEADLRAAFAGVS